MNMIIGTSEHQNKCPFFQNYMLLIHIGIASYRQFQYLLTTYVFSIIESYLRKPRAVLKCVLVVVPVHMLTYIFTISFLKQILNSVK